MAGVVPMCSTPDGSCYILLRDAGRGMLETFGGGREELDPSLVYTASREGAEESLGSFGSTEVIFKALSDLGEAADMSTKPPTYAVPLGTISPGQMEAILHGFAHKMAFLCMNGGRAGKAARREAKSCFFETLRLVWLPVQTVWPPGASVPAGEITGEIAAADGSFGRQPASVMLAESTQKYLQQAADAGWSESRVRYLRAPSTISRSLSELYYPLFDPALEEAAKV
mmetsp:Transcript_163919/g.298965  ORF Transcript_163919/g.298965 Transcript_163919/m.298965 type:complete len:227 (-) Transcript_163919:98-778(-)